MKPGVQSLLGESQWLRPFLDAVLEKSGQTENSQRTGRIIRSEHVSELEGADFTDQECMYVRGWLGDRVMEEKVLVLESQSSSAGS